MEELHHERRQLSEEIRILRKISNATRIATSLRKEGKDVPADCIDSLVREIERLRKES